MSDRAAIIPDMPIFGSDGALVGTVHRVSGVRIIVNHVGVSDADQHVIPIARVAEVTDRVVLDCPAADARPERMAVGINRSFAPLVWLGIGAIGIALVYGAVSMIGRGAAPKALPTPVPTATPGQGTVATSTGALAPVASVTTLGPAEANATTLSRYLVSDAPAAQRFAFDTAFAAGSASLSAPGEASVRGIAGVMATHLNTQIKLAASGGGLGARRAAAIKRALIAYGIAEYRIATGAARAPVRGGSGVELVVLAK